MFSYRLSKATGCGESYKEWPFERNPERRSGYASKQLHYFPVAEKGMTRSGVLNPWLLRDYRSVILLNAHRLEHGVRWIGVEARLKSSE